VSSGTYSKSDSSDSSDTSSNASHSSITSKHVTSDEQNDDYEQDNEYEIGFDSNASYSGDEIEIPYSLIRKKVH